MCYALIFLVPTGQSTVQRGHHTLTPLIVQGLPWGHFQFGLLQIPLPRAPWHLPLGEPVHSFLFPVLG